MKNCCCGSEETERPMPGRKERVNHKTLTFMLAFLYTHTHTAASFAAWLRGAACGVAWLPVCGTER